MPIYEYLCNDCNHTFDTLRKMSEADAPIECSTCQSSNTSRKISVFAACSDSGMIAGGGSSCSSCNSSSCSTCG